MTVVSNGCVNPMSVISGTTGVPGDTIRCFNAATGSGEVPVGTLVYINESKQFTCINGQTAYTRTGAPDLFAIGDTLIVGTSPPSPLATNTTYWVVGVGSNYINISASKGGSPITSTSTSSGNFYIGCVNIPYPVLRPYPVASMAMKEVIFSPWGSNSNIDTNSVYIRADPSPLSKPTVNSTYQNISIFIYNSTSATVLNLNSSTNNHLIYTGLSFTNFMNKIGTAKFVAINPGNATSTELDLLLAGSAANPQKDNLIAIIQGSSIVWSGKIIRSTQNKTGLFDDPLVQTWNIDCESDIVRMKYQQVKAANKKEYRDKIGNIINKLVENDSSGDINWNGLTAQALYESGTYSDEGVIIDYNINEADMFTHFMILSKTLDFDWRTRLVHYRATFTRSSNSYTVNNTGIYSEDDLIGRWMIISSETVGNGVVSFGKITDNTKYIITCSMTTTPAASGTLIVLMDPVLDVLGNLMTPTPVQTFKINAQHGTYANGYGFEDKTDRSMFATKIVSKSKTQSGATLTSSLPAVTPWVDGQQIYDKSFYITKRTDGRILQFIDGAPPYGAGIMYIEGWGYDLTDGLFGIFGSVQFYYPRTDTGSPSNVQELYWNGIRATYFNVSGLWNTSPLTGGLFVWFKTADLDPAPYPSGHYVHSYQRYYVQFPSQNTISSGDDIIINNEIIDCDSISLDSTNGYYIRFLADSTTGHRLRTDPYIEAHPPGTIIWLNAYFSETSPMTGSPVYYHGIITQTYLSDIIIPLSVLQKNTTAQFVKNSEYHRKAMFWCLFNNWWKTGSKKEFESMVASPIDVGDTIICLQDDNATAGDLLYGQLKNVWQVVGWTLDTKDMKVIVELGDFERNVYTSMIDKTSALHLTVS